MWDRPEIMNSVSSALIAASILLAVYGGIFALANLPLFPVRHVSVSNALEPDAELQHVTREQVQAVITERLKGTFFTVDLEAARTAFSGLPWVRGVEVRRTWPDKLEVAIEEQVAFANWSDGKLVNTHGELFDAALISSLPAFSGPPGSEAEVTRRYREFSADFKKLGFSARQVALSPRLAWDIRLDNGLAVKLGRDHPRDPLLARLDRFVAAYADSVGRVSGRLDLADLRYTQGFALHLSPGASFQASGSKPPAKESVKSKDAAGNGAKRAPAKGGA
jgi:cell division protein FtsQ